jgi:hypothetical protein
MNMCLPEKLDGVHVQEAAARSPGGRDPTKN